MRFFYFFFNSNESFSDRQYVRLVLVALFLILLNQEAWANPFAKLQEEVEGNYPKSSSVFRIFSKAGPEDSLYQLFSTGTKESPGEYEEEKSDLPKYLPFSNVISNTVTHDIDTVWKKHTITKKDTLPKIAKQYNSDLQRIKKHNNLGKTLAIGQILEIPVIVKSSSLSRVVTRRVFINPVPQGGKVTSRFGRRVDPFNRYNRVFHSGLDLAASIGTPVVASSEGEVVFTGRNGGYGNSIIIQHKDGYKTVYAHCSQIVVQPGEPVKMGRVIATVGRTGTATGAHLHFEVFRNGKIMNPESALSLVERTVTKVPKSEVAGL